MAENKEMIESLLHELEHYEKYGKKDRADQVKDELKKFGWKAPKEKTETKTKKK